MPKTAADNYSFGSRSMTALYSRVDHLEQYLGNIEDDTRRLVENLCALTEGSHLPHKMTHNMRRIVVETLRQLNTEIESARPQREPLNAPGSDSLVRPGSSMCAMNTHDALIPRIETAQ